MTVVVVGAGLAGLRTVEGLRSRGHTGAIVLIGGEDEAPYDRPPLSKATLRDGSGTPYLRALEEYDALDVDLLLGNRATGVDVDRRTVRLADGRDVDYDALVLATGADPRVLPKVRSPRLRTLRTASDAAGLRAEIEQHGQIAVIGAGFLGCEVAATARALGASVTLVETQPTPLARVLGVEVGAEIAELHRAHDVDLRLGQSLTGFAAEDDGVSFTFEDSSVVGAEVVLVAIGASPSTGWLDGSEIKVDDGICCDEFGRASAPHVWAVGDSSSWWDPSSGRHRRFEHWTNAGDQAALVAANLVATEESQLTPMTAAPYFWSDQYDVKLQALGSPEPDDLVEILRVGPAQRLVAVYGRAGIATAVVGLSAPRHVMRTRGQLEAGASLGDVLVGLRGS